MRKISRPPTRLSLPCIPVALILFLADDEEGEHAAEAAVLAFDNCDRWRYPFDGAPPFMVRLDRTGSTWVVGSYDGTVRCGSGSASTPARGTFRLSEAR